MNKEDLAPIVIDLTSKNKLDESFLRMFGWGIEKILKIMFGGSPVPVSVRGSPGDVQSFVKTLGREKNYMDSYIKYGLDNPQTFRNKSKLDSAVSAFQRKTGLKWPFK
tara:strand:- start:670 stop:993 length:324 start_codon:yes stop_codon:yes gene_type:complete